MRKDHIIHLNGTTVHLADNRGKKSLFGSFDPIRWGEGFYILWSGDGGENILNRKIEWTN